MVVWLTDVLREYVHDCCTRRTLLLEKMAMHVVVEAEHCITELGVERATQIFAQKV